MTMQPTDKELAEALEVLRVVTSRAMQDSPTRNAYDTVAAALRTARQATPESASEAIPQASKWLEENGSVASMDWQCGWDACRVEYPSRSIAASGEGQQGDWRAWVVENLPESLHGLELLDVLGLLLAGGIAAEQDAMKATQQQAGQAVAVPTQECYSCDEGDSWFDHPADEEIVGGMKVGETFELMVSHWSVRRTYVVTKVPDGTNDDYEVEIAASEASG